MDVRRRRSREIHGGRFAKATGYVVEAGRFARLKCVQKHDGKCNLVINVLIDSVDQNGKETFATQFISVHKGERHSDSCAYASTNGALERTVANFDENALKEAIKLAKQRNQFNGMVSSHKTIVTKKVARKSAVAERVSQLEKQNFVLKNALLNAEFKHQRTCVDYSRIINAKDAQLNEKVAQLYAKNAELLSKEREIAELKGRIRLLTATNLFKATVTAQSACTQDASIVTSINQLAYNLFIQNQMHSQNG